MTATRDTMSGGSGGRPPGKHGGGSGGRPQGGLSQPELVRAEVGRLASAVLALQDEDGCWRGRAAGTDCADIDDLLVREFLGTSPSAETQAAAGLVMAGQRPDGSWAGCDSPGCAGLAWTGSGDSCALSATIRAYLALRVAGDPPDAYHMALAASWIRDAGGIAAAPQAARLWLAMFGLSGWDDVAVPIPEVIYLPVSRLRPVVAAQAVIGALRPSRPVAFGLPELEAGRSPVGGEQAQGGGLYGPGFSARLLAAGRPALAAVPVGRAAALRRCGECIAADTEGDAWSVIALHLLGYPARHASAGWARTPEPVAMPSVLRTALAAQALAEAGLPGDDPALAVAANWLLARRVPAPARWPAGCTDGEPVGWSLDGTGSADAECTAGVVLALSYLDPSAWAVRRCAFQAAWWLAGAQRRDGGWSRGPGAAAGVAEAVVPASTEVTAAVVRALAAAGPPGSRAIRRGVAWLLATQQPDGSWQGSAADNAVTEAGLHALTAAGVLPGKPAIRHAIGWLTGRQNADGGWGERRFALSTVTGTTRALSALLAAGGAAAGGADAADSITRGVRWLEWAMLSDAAPDASSAAATLRDGGGDLAVALASLDALGTWMRARQAIEAH